ncbi:MAG: hypothetical protein EOP04_03475 [Proteobacteria bacterium]|nr:MAG: hypothetical protein EOP04_03475 [Pseudomonadota bacterium]
MIQCGFCLDNVAKLHKKSHTLPKWMTKHAVSPRGVHLSKTSNPKITQRSQWAEIICEGCEKLFSKFDTYAANLFGEDSKEFIEKNRIVAERFRYPETDVFFYRIKGINAKELQKFILSVVVRQNLFLLKNGEDSIIAADQQSRMRMIIQEDKFDAGSFPIQIFNTDRDCVALPPVVISSDGSIRFMGAGSLVIVHMNAENLVEILEMVLNENENFFVERSSAQIGIMEDVKQMISEMPQSSKDYVNQKLSLKK